MESFWGNVDQQGQEECWEWQGSRNERDYGYLTVAKKRWIAHRLAYTLAHGPIPAGLFVLHRCDNPPCCNPGHLFLGTALDNSLDCIAKGRWAHGESSGAWIIDDQTVIWIREQYWMEGATGYALAKAVGISSMQIHNIVQGKARKQMTRRKHGK